MRITVACLILLDISVLVSNKQLAIVSNKQLAVLDTSIYKLLHRSVNLSLTYLHITCSEVLRFA
jgi:hypothetical protein